MFRITAFRVSRVVLAAALASVAAALALPATAVATPSVSSWSGRAGAWVRPVPGEVMRVFSYGTDPFAAGQHRGVDLAAAPGTAVRAPCTGRVVAAGRVGSSGRVVTVACGPWHATVLPLARVEVRRGDRVTAGAEVGTAGAEAGTAGSKVGTAGSGVGTARSGDGTAGPEQRGGGSPPPSARHAGIHFGVRRASDRFGYVDPLRFLTRGRPPSPLAPRPPRRGRRPTPLVAPAASPLPTRHPHALRRPLSPIEPAIRPAAPTGAPAAPAGGSPGRPGAPADRAGGPAGRALAPWPVWVGAALLLASASGGLLRGRRRRRRGPATATVRAARTAGPPR